MNKIIINTPEDFINCNLDACDEIVISENLSLPFSSPESKHFYFETNNKYPLSYRIKYLHPRKYYGLFSSELSKKIDAFRIFVKKGNRLLFKLSDSNLTLVCTLLALCYQDCKSENIEYKDVTNIPFPLKKSTQDGKGNWIWTCYWNDHNIDCTETEEQLRNLLNIQRRKFPLYNGSEFPVTVLSEIQEGVTAFCVEVEEGHIIVEPYDDIVEIVVNSLDTEFVSGKHSVVTFSCSIYEYDYEVNFYKFLQFMSLYFCSLQHMGVAYEVKDKKLYSMKIISDNGFIDMPYAFLYKTKEGNVYSNFYNEIKKILDSCLFPENCSQSERTKMETTVLDRSENNQYNTIGPRLKYKVERFQNLNIRFTETTLSNFEALSIFNNDEDKRIEKLHEVLANFKNDIILVIK